MPTSTSTPDTLTTTLFEGLPAAIREDLEGVYQVTDEHVAFLRENGYVKLRSVLKPETIAYFEPIITSEVKRLNTMHLPMEERGTYAKAFLQIMNLWKRGEGVQPLSFAPKLARVAAELMEVGGVRMYHDQALYKEPGGGITPWHADQYYWPFESDRTITAWIPLHDVGMDMGPLAFARKTHRMAFGRNLAIGDDSEVLIQKSLKEAQADIDESPFGIGDISYHLGWTFHRAGANTTADPRRVMTMIYVDEAIKLSTPANKAQESDWHNWCPGAEIGGKIETPMNPVLWSRGNE